MILRSVLLMFALAMLPHAYAENSQEFDHFDTNFPLTGMHANVECSDCHINGIFKGTSQQCRICHNGVLATGKSVDHVLTNDECDNCHTTFSMVDARFEHGNIVTPCSSCHNGVSATGKHNQHITTSQECDDCHVTTSWLNVRFDHSQVTAPCSSCHNGVNASGKTPGHIVVTQECDACHTTTSWLGASFDHSLITSPCSSCHNNVIATGKHTNHVPTTQECDSCHNTAGWAGAGVDHSLVTGTCVSCHNNIIATGKPVGHAITSDDCELCHTTTNWTQIIFMHSTVSEHNSSVACGDCHVGNNYALSPYQFQAYAPDCAGCHADDYKVDSHKKTESPSTVFYTVDELRDCSGSCHLYNDNTYTTILEIRSGHHFIDANAF